MTLGQRIQAHRTRLGLSQEGLGEKLGVSRQAVSRWEADGAVPDTDKLIALSRLFGITLNELLQVEDPPEQGAKKPRGRWKLLLLAAVCFLAGVLVGRAPDIAASLAQPELEGLLAECGVGLAAGPYVQDGVETVELRVTALLADPDALEGAQVFFQAETRDGETIRAQAETDAPILAGGRYWATLTAPNTGGEVSIVLVKNGREQTAAVGEYGHFS